jgi:hypothetical protein
MFKIFAKRGTRLKAAMPVPDEFVQLAMEVLNETFGPDWVFVDKLKPGECIVFTDNMIYEGYHPAINRYSDAIQPLNYPWEVQTFAMRIEDDENEKADNKNTTDGK